VGDIVVVHDDIPRVKWQLAVVKELQRGQDNVVRSAVSQTVNGITSQPIVKLYPLEVNAESATPVRDFQDASDDKGDSTPDTSDSNGPKVPPRPQRSASVRARAQVADWAQILRAPEDVVN